MTQALPYAERLNALLRPRPERAWRVLDLFAGCGGLGLGFEAAGFHTHGFEMVDAYVRTYAGNLAGPCELAELQVGHELPDADVVIGGPPCQPFSVGGNQRGLKDSRDGFPVFIDAVRRLKPRLWLFENVRGLLYRNRWYFDEVVEALTELGYDVEFRLLNAKHFGVPQNRERVFVVGHRGGFAWPTRSNRYVTAGDAIRDSASLVPRGSRFLTPQMDHYVAKYELASKCRNPRDLHLDRPARTLTCRNLAGATGDMQRVLLPDGSRRRLVPREAARLQAFPDWFKFAGSETDVFYQIGNAVPPLLAYKLALAVADCLDGSSGDGLRTGETHKPQLRLFDGSEAPPSMFEFTEKHGGKKFREKPARLKRLIREALQILHRLGMPMDRTGRQLEMMAAAFLAVCDVRRPGGWAKAKDVSSGRSMTTRAIIEWVNEHLGESISSGSYDDIRRKHLKFPVAGQIVISTARDKAAVNDPKRGYALSAHFAPAVRGFGDEDWGQVSETVMLGHREVAAMIAHERSLELQPVVLPSGTTLELGPGKHNRLQIDVVESFLPRYGFGAEVLYLGDASNKLLRVEERRLNALGFFELKHGKLPDVVAYSESRNWLYLIECVTSAGPMDPLRVQVLRDLAEHCTASLIFVTAFPDRKTYRRFAGELAWETEVWLADSPDHLIHLDGEKFLGPYEP